MPQSIQGSAIVCGPKYFLQHMSTNDKYFAKPYFQGIYVMDADYANADIRPPLYGDTMRMIGWDFLRIPFGAISDNQEVLTRRSGWKYIYNHTYRTFDAYDNNGNVYVHRDNIKTIGDLHIDFTIQMSHQFEVWFSYSDIYPFFNIASLKPKLYGESYMWTPVISNGDKLYGTDHRVAYSNSTDIYKRISSVETYNTIDLHIPIRRIVYEVNNIFSVMPNGIAYNDKCTGSGGYSYDNDDSGDGNNNPTPHNKDRVKGHVVIPGGASFTMLYFMLSHCMYPRLNTTIRLDETNNNRPVYEPWLIWGVFKFLFLHREEVDDDEYEIDVFDYNCSNIAA